MFKKRDEARSSSRVDSSRVSDLLFAETNMKNISAKQEEIPSSKSWTLSLISLLAIGALTASIASWHGSVETPTNYPSDHSTSRFLQQDTVTDAIDDDTTRDGVCKEYLMNFLNGTTDARDECAGMLNAYQAADCVDDSHTQSQNEPSFLKRRHRHPDGNITDDDVLIDDFIENWACCSSIYEYYTRHCHEPQLASYKLLGIVSVLIVCGLVKSLIRAFQVEWIPDAAACILVGATVGGILKLINTDLIDEKLSFFDNDLFLHILLPPIVFQQALAIDKKAFRRDLFPILTFAFFGTFCSAVIVGYLTHWLTSIGSGTTLPLLDSLLFGSLISSIDPVATLGILSSVGVGKTDTLYTLIFGESLLNDGVAIVLFDTLVGHLTDGAVVNHHTLHESVVKFVQITLGSIGIGIASGIVCTVYFWMLRRKHTPVVEVAIFFCWALIPYYISDAVGYSGIIAIMTMGFALDFLVLGGCQSEEEQWLNYMEIRYGASRNSACGFHPIQFAKELVKAFCGRGHLSSKATKHVGFVAEVITGIMETAIFAYLGLFLFNNQNVWDFRLNTTAIVGCLSSRAVVVLIISALVNFLVWLDMAGQLKKCFASLFGRGNSITPVQGDDESSMGSTAHVYLDRKTQQIIFLSGVRGAVSFALVENIPVYDAVRKHGSHYKAELKAMTSVSILFTVFVFGALTYFLIKEERDRGATTGPLSHRLLSAPLLSDDERSSDDELESTGAP